MTDAIQRAEQVGLRQGRAEAMQLLRAEMNNPLNAAQARSVVHGVFGALKKRNDAFDVELARGRAAAEPCDYCVDGQRTGLPSNACENCLNTGLKNPIAEDLR